MSGIKDFSETYVTEQNIDEKTEEWLEKIAPYQWRETELVSKNKVALLVVDMNKPFVDEGGPLASANARAILPRIAELVQGFRQSESPVIWIVQGHHSVKHDRGKRLAAWWPNPLLEGTSDVEMATGLEVRDDEKVITKRRYSGFYQTDLECTLRNLGIEQVVICGVLTHVCPYTTAFDAFFRDLCVFYPADTTASLNSNLHITALQSIAGWCGYVIRARDIIAQLSTE